MELNKLKGQAGQERRATNMVNMDLLMEQLRDGTISRQELLARMEAPDTPATLCGERIALFRTAES